MRQFDNLQFATNKAEGHAISLITGTGTTNQGGERIDPEYRDRVIDEFRDGASKVRL